MSDTLTDAQRLWAAGFCGIDLTPAAQEEAAPGGPSPGKVVRVEYTGKFHRKPPGEGAYSESQLSDWIDRHPRRTQHEVMLSTGADGKRIVDKSTTSAALWARGMYYARMGEDQSVGITFEIWCGDEGDGEEIHVIVKLDSS